METKNKATSSADALSSLLRAATTRRKSRMTARETEVAAAVADSVAREYASLTARVRMHEGVLRAARMIIEDLRDRTEPGSRLSQDAARMLGVISDCSRSEEDGQRRTLVSSARVAALVAGGPVPRGPGPDLTPAGVEDLAAWRDRRDRGGG
jgi:hypothetical protein